MRRRKRHDAYSCYVMITADNHGARYAKLKFDPLLLLNWELGGRLTMQMDSHSLLAAPYLEKKLTILPHIFSFLNALLILVFEKKPFCRICYAHSIFCNMSWRIVLYQQIINHKMSCLPTPIILDGISFNSEQNKRLLFFYDGLAVISYFFLPNKK